MGTTSLTAASEIERYLRTGQHDGLHRAWPGGGLADCARDVDLTLRSALIERVMGQTRHAAMPELLASLDVIAHTCKGVEPMVRGLARAVPGR
jgi:hypothetical protein